MNASFVNWITSQLLICVMLTTLSLTAVAETKKPNVQQHYTFDLPQQSVADSLNDLATQTGAQFLFPFQLAQSKTAKPIIGHFTLLEATAQLLQNTGLKSDLVDGVLTISPADDAGTSGNQNHKGKRMNIHQTHRKTLLSRPWSGYLQQVVVAQRWRRMDEAATVRVRIDEIIVSASKQGNVGIQDFAGSISAISSEDIKNKGFVGMTDYLTFVPGVTMLDLGTGQNQIIIRGIGLSLYEQPTVSTYFGEVPLSNPVAVFAGSSDLKLVDMERVEVLRGPQGTLYGSGAMGGTVRNIPMAPNLSEMEGSVEVGYSTMDESDDNSNKVVGVLNVPLVEDKLALRVAAYRFDNAGYIDHVSSPAIESLAARTGTLRKLAERYQQLYSHWWPSYATLASQ